MTFAGLIWRWTMVALVTCCSSDIRPDAPPIPSEPLLRSCSAVLESSCDSGFAACELDGSCGCYVGPRLIACSVPCVMPAVPTCRSIGCNELDTFECAIATGDCWCVRRGGGERVECELDGCG